MNQSSMEVDAEMNRGIKTHYIEALDYYFLSKKLRECKLGKLYETNGI